MKKIFFSFLVLFSVSLSYAQVYQVFSMHMVRVEGDLKAFEKVQSIYMQKVAQNAVENGDIAFWAFLKNPTYSFDECNLKPSLPVRYKVAFSVKALSNISGLLYELPSISFVAFFQRLHIRIVPL